MYDNLADHGVNFYAGVPDSLLKNFCGYVNDHTPEENHIIAANEGSAVAIGAVTTGAPGRVGTAETVVGGPALLLSSWPSGAGGAGGAKLSASGPEAAGS